jgi:hypothetical protein
VAATTHEVRQRPPLRALALAAVLMVVGLVLVLMAQILDENLLLTVGGLVVLVLGALLFGVSLFIARAMRIRVVLDDDGYVIQGRDATQSGRWADVRRVTRTADRVTLYRADGSRVQLVVPRGRPSDLDSLGEDIAQRLDADRGYGS